MRKHTIIAVLAMALVTPAVRAADVSEADFQKAMKDVQAGANAIRGANGDAAAIGAAAKSMDAALASVEGFWKARKDDEAIKMNTAARAAVAAVVKAAEAKEPVADATRAMFGSCRTCHDIHREQLPDKTYKVK